MALSKAQVLVTELIEFRDFFIERNGVENVHHRTEEIERKIKDVLLELDQLQLLIDNKASFFYLRGQALNISPNYDSRAVDCLSKAVKLDPSLVEAWNELGECYWKNKNIDGALNCFNSAITKCKNKVSLRNLSMVQRQLGTDFDSKVANIQQSVTTAKEAVAMDVKDGHSWFVLGNAYLSSFFFAGQSPVTLKQCMVAYTKAEQDKNETTNPDLHYNRAVAFKYQEHFTEALDGFQKAHQLDPTWKIPIEDKIDLVNRLKLATDVCCNKGRLKRKKLTNLINQIKDADFGPYANGTYTSPLNKSIDLKKTCIKELSLNRNDGKVICGKVIAVIPVKDTVPFPFILMDKNEDCVAVSVFNLAIGKGVIVGDSVALPEPYLEEVNLQLEEQQITYRNIRVDNPVVLVINKRKVGSERLSFSVLDVTNKSS